jgi:hypothetical protein
MTAPVPVAVNRLVGDPFVVAATAQQPSDIVTEEVTLVVSAPAAAGLARLDPDVDECLRVVDLISGAVYLVLADDGGSFLATRDEDVTRILADAWASVRVGAGR